MKTIDIEFKADALTLRGTLHLPGTQVVPPLVVGSHGLEGSMHSDKQQVLSRLLPENHIAFFRFDHRGCGQSQGDFVTDTSLAKRSQDLLAAVRHVMALGLTQKKLALFGSSMGGAACINAWDTLESQGFAPAGAVLCAAPVISQTIVNIPTQATDKRPSLPLRFFADNLLFDLTPKVRRLHHLLIFHGDADEVVPLSNAHLLHQNACAPKELVIHKDGRHRMGIEKHQKDFEIRALQWYHSILNSQKK